jgi:hypothetical protein
MKEGCLFLFVLFCGYAIQRTEMLRILLFLVSLGCSRMLWDARDQKERVHGLFGSMTFRLVVQKFLNIEMIS